MMATIANEQRHIATTAPPGYYPFKVGQLTCLAISDGSLKVPTKLGATNISDTELETYLGEHNQDLKIYPLQITALAIRNGNQTILVDSGFGHLPGMDGQPLPTCGKVVQNLAAAGIQPSDINTVLITHLHPDHFGGAIDRSGGLVFENATYYVSQEEFEFWSQPHPDMGEAQVKPEMVEGFIQQAHDFIAATEGRLKLFPAGAEVMDGISSIHLPGHTNGQVAFAIASQGETLMMTGDVWGHPLVSLQHPDWRFAYDVHHENAVRSRQKAIHEAIDRKALLLVPHFPWPSLGRIGLRDGIAHWDAEWYAWSVE